MAGREGVGSVAPVRLAFAFTDIEGSTRLLERLGAAYAGVLGDHATIIRTAIARWDGREVDTQGDAFFAVFGEARAALGFAVEVQRGLATHPWPEGVTVRVRIGLHAGEAIPTRTGFVGMDIHHGARVAAAAHGGQVLCSGALAAAIPDTRAAMGTEDEAEPPVLLPLGAFTLKDIQEPVELLQVAAPGLASAFPPPRTLDAPDDPPAPGDAPYPGLVPFEEADAGRFFGRTELIAELVERLGQDGFLAIVGASGSGKSSLLRAGVLPGVRTRLVTAGEPDARLAVMTPGDDPVARLDAALGRLAGPPHLLAVDQLEELATLCRDETARLAFADRLVALVRSGTAVAVALRADLYDTVAPFDGLRELVATHQAYPGPLGPDGLREAIEGPATAGGWRLAPGLSDLLIADLGEEPGSLPLLAHALRETWERRRGRVLGLRGYLDAGGVQGAIARTAERLADGLDDQHLAVAQAILLRLVRPGDGGPDTRRRAPVTELLATDPDAAICRDVLERLVAARLVVIDGPIAEVAHEALIRAWPRLRAWLDADREALLLARAVTDAAADWRRTGDDPSRLWRGARVDAALALPRGTLTPDEHAFLAASHAREVAEAEEREQLRARELEAARRAAEAERARADEAALANRRLRRRAVVLVGLLAIAVGLGAFATLQVQRADEAAGEARTQADLALERQAQAEEARGVAEAQRAEAERQARIAISRQLAARSAVERSRPDLSLLLALEAVDTAPTTEARSSLLDALASTGQLRTLLARKTPAYGLTFSPDGTVLRAVAIEDGRVLAWDLASGAMSVEGRIPDHEASPLGSFPVVSGDGRVTAVVTRPSLILIGDAATGEVVRELRSSGGFLGTIALSRDGRRLAVAQNEGASLWDVETGQRLADLLLEGQQDSAIDLAFSPDGTAVAWTSWDGSVGAWDVATGTATTIVPAGGEPYPAIVFSPDGARIAAGRGDGLVTVRDRVTGASIMELGPGTAPDLTHLAFVGDGQILVTAGAGPTLEAWEVATGTPIGPPMVLAGDSVPVLQSLAGSPDGAVLASVDFDGTIALWDLGRRSALASVLQPPVANAERTLTPDGTAVATINLDGSVDAVDLESGRTLWGPIAITHPITTDPFVGPWRLVVSPSGGRLAVAEPEGPAQQWDSATGRPVGGPIGGHGTAAVIGLAYSPDGSTLVTGTQDGWLQRWDASTGEALGPAVRPDTPEAAGYLDGAESFSEYVEDPVFSPDGRLLATAGARSAVLWDARTGLQLGEALGGHPSSVFAVAFSPDGGTLAVGGFEGEIFLWDVARRERVAQLHASGLVGDLAFDRSGARLLAVAHGALELWDVASGRRIGQPFAPMDGSGAIDVGDGIVRTLAEDGAVLEWVLAEAAWPGVACAIAGRDLTTDEWATELGEAAYRRTCTDRPTTGT